MEKLRNTLLLDTLCGREVSRPPVWLMRQAGRVLPRYRELSAQYGFKKLMANADLAATVTLLPVDTWGVDAAILFSDILIVPMAMGLQVEWTRQGPQMPRPLLSYDDPCSRLKTDTSILEQSFRTIDSFQKKRHGVVPLIGFCGGPLTCLCYMLQGNGSKDGFTEAVKYFYTQRRTTELLVDAFTEMSIIYATGQVQHGIEVFQLFESFAGVVPDNLYRELFLPSVRRILSAVRSLGVPTIFFPKGIGAGLPMITPDVCDTVSIDWQTSLDEACSLLHPSMGLQGNMDPRLLHASKPVIARHLEQYISFFRRHPRWIFNLGHGLTKDIPAENVAFVVNWVKQAHW